MMQENIKQANVKGFNAEHISHDQQILFKIRKYILKLKLLFERIEHQSYKEIDDGTDGLALTQCVTNLYELAIKIEHENVPHWLDVLRSNRVAKMRNIESHNYDATNWDIAKSICRMILHDVTVKSIDSYLKELRNTD